MLLTPTRSESNASQHYHLRIPIRPHSEASILEDLLRDEDVEYEVDDAG